MLVRIVKMTFDPSRIPDFLRLFEVHRAQIRAFPGCEHLELWQDADQPHVFFTYSHWQRPEDLATYRASALFRHVWGATRVLFAARPEAHSLVRRQPVAAP